MSKYPLECQSNSNPGINTFRREEDSNLLRRQRLSRFALFCQHDQSTVRNTQERRHPPVAMSSILRERGSPRPRRRKPKLSPDLISKHFTVPYSTANPNYADIEWSPLHTRFVLWFHLTTNLQFNSIAIAFNATFPDNLVEMAPEDAGDIFEVLEGRFPMIRHQLLPDGHWHKPKERGWTPCDHGMCCSKLAALGKRTPVTRSPKIRTRHERELAEMATALWQGTWAELLTCPRAHDRDFDRLSGNFNRSDSSKENRKPGYSAAAMSSGSRELPRMTGAFLSDESTSTRSNAASSIGIWVDSSAKGSRSPSKKSTISSGQSRASGENVIPCVEEDDPAAIWVDSSARDSRSSGVKSHASAGNALPGTDKSSSTGNSSYASAKTQLSGARPVDSTRRSRASSRRPDVLGTNIADPDRLPASRFHQFLTFVAGTDAMWLLLHQTVFNIAWICAMNPIFLLIMDNFESFRRDSSIVTPDEILSIVCTLIGANHLTGNSLMVIRRAIFRRWETELGSTEMRELSQTARMILRTLTMVIAMTVCFTCGLPNYPQQLMQKLAKHVESGRRPA